MHTRMFDLCKDIGSHGSLGCVDRRTGHDNIPLDFALELFDPCIAYNPVDHDFSLERVR